MSAASSRSMLWGPFTRLGLAVAFAAAAVDQGLKLWLLFVTDLGALGRITVFPFVDLVLTRNTGISYGLFPQEGPLGQWALLALKPLRSCCSGSGLPALPRDSLPSRSASSL